MHSDTAHEVLHDPYRSNNPNPSPSPIRLRPPPLPFTATAASSTVGSLTHSTMAAAKGSTSATLATLSKLVLRGGGRGRAGTRRVFGGFLRGALGIPGVRSHLNGIKAEEEEEGWNGENKDEIVEDDDDVDVDLDPLVAYYCRLYAMERGLKIPQKDRTKTTNSLLISLINQLEKDKKSIKSGPDDYLYVEGFASSVFAKADKQDRAGRADLNTAKTFYAASIFFEILSQFGELQPDIEQKFKYAVWKAADIRKALKEGRKPEPGPPGGDKDLSVPSSPPSSTYDVGHNENFSSTHPTPSAGAATHHEEKDMRRSDSFQTNSPGADISSEPLDRSYSYIASQPPASSPSTYPTDYPPGDHHQHPPSNTQDIPGYPQTYHSQSYPDDQPFPSPKLHPENPQNYHPEMPPPPYSYPNFQSYPSFHETTFPAAPTHQPSYYHNPDSSSYSNQTSAGPSVSSHAPPTVKYDYGSGSVNHVAAPAPPTTVASASPPAYTYDSNYLPPVEMITEAHKAARFAVGALAFDDVPVAVEFLRKSLELLTNPKAETH